MCGNSHLIKCAPLYSTLSDAPGAPQGFLYARQRRNRGNVVIGLALAGFCGAVYAYSMWAVKQEDFSDVDERALQLRQAEERRLQKEQEGMSKQ